MIQTARKNVRELRQKFDDALERQKEAHRVKEELIIAKQLDNAKEDYIKPMYYWEMYHSPRCWLTVAVARREYATLTSESQRVMEVREQIQMGYLGCKWEEAWHAWSCKGHTYTGDELFDFFIDKVLPLAKKLKVPPEAPIKWPEPPI